MRSIPASLTLAVGSGLVVAALLLGVYSGLFANVRAASKQVAAPVAPQVAPGPELVQANQEQVGGKTKVVKEIYVYIPVNLSAAEIGEILAKAGVVAHADDFVAAARSHSVAERLQRGLFHFSEGEPLDQVLQKLVQGQS